MLTRTCKRTDHGQRIFHGRFYFGWQVVLALFICICILYGVGLYSFILLTSPIAAEYGWSSAKMGNLVSAIWLTAPLVLFAAPLIRRFGAWPLLFAGLACQGLVMLGLALSTDFWQVYALRVVMGLGKIAMVISVPVIVTRWFSRRFATAIAIVWAGGSAGGFLIAPITQQLITEVGWRSTSMLIAGGVWALMAVVYLLVRQFSSPADLGQTKDGNPHRGAIVPHEQPGQANTDQILDVASVLRTIYWPTAIIMFLSVIGMALAVVSILSQEPALMAYAGSSPATTAFLLSVISLGSMIGAASIGVILDRWPSAVAALLVGGLMYSGLLLFYFLLQSPGMFLVLFVGGFLGYAMGAGEVLWMTLTRRQFGAAMFATTYGGWAFAMQIGYGSAGGLSGWTLDRVGPEGLLIFIAIVYLPAVVFSLWRPQGTQARSMA